MGMKEAHKNMDEEKACDRCGFLQNVELHHINRRIDGGSDEKKNLRWLCRGCHDFEHARMNCLKAIKAEEERIAVLRKRLEIIEKLNPPAKVLERGYQSYWGEYPAGLPSASGKGCKA